MCNCFKVLGNVDVVLRSFLHASYLILSTSLPHDWCSEQSNKIVLADKLKSLKTLAEKFVNNQCCDFFGNFP